MMYSLIIVLSLSNFNVSISELSSKMREVLKILYSDKLSIMVEVYFIKKFLIDF